MYKGNYKMTHTKDAIIRWQTCIVLILPFIVILRLDVDCKSLHNNLANLFDIGKLVWII